MSGMILRFYFILISHLVNPLFLMPGASCAFILFINKLLHYTFCKQSVLRNAGGVFGFPELITSGGIAFQWLSCFKISNLIAFLCIKNIARSSRWWRKRLKYFGAVRCLQFASLCFLLFLWSPEIKIVMLSVQHYAELNVLRFNFLKRIANVKNNSYLKEFRILQ